MSTPHIDGVLEHKRQVGIEMNKVTNDLFSRAIEHDYSKFSKEEMDVFEEHTPRLKSLTYGTPEYIEQLKLIKPALDHHYKNNRHHPEYFANGINEMNLIDLIEMICDWSASVKRHTDGNIYRSLEVNKERFGISDQLYGILKNTVDFLNSK